MKKFIIALMILSLPVYIAAQSLVTDDLKSYESTWAGVAGNAGAFYGADTLQFLQILGKRGIHPECDDMAVCVSIDTSLGTVTDTTTFSLYAYPITNSTYSKSDFLTQALWKYEISLDEIDTGTSSVSFAANQDTTYVFHSDTWWEGIGVYGIVYRLITTATDSFYIKEFKPLRVATY